MTKMVRTYRLEFNEKQQRLHLDNFTHEKETHGWVTILDHCTDIEFKVFESFVNCTPKKKLTKNYLLKCAKEIKKFMNNLSEYGLAVNQA